MLDRLNEKAVEVLQISVVDNVFISYNNGVFYASKSDKIICKGKSMTKFFDEMYCNRLVKTSKGDGENVKNN